MGEAIITRRGGGALYYTNTFSQGFGHNSINASFDCPFKPTMLVGEVWLFYVFSPSSYLQQYRQFRCIDNNLLAIYFGQIDKMLISQQGGGTPVIDANTDGYSRTGNSFVSYNSGTGKITINFSTSRSIVTAPSDGCRGVTYCNVRAYKFR